jgi:hypothetical protein
LAGFAFWPVISYAQMDMDIAQAQSAEVMEPGNNYLLQSKNSGDGSAIKMIERPEDNLFIIEMAMGKKEVIDNAMLVYIEDDDVLIPLSRLVQDIMFQIRVDPAAGTAEGWFINEENTFQLIYPYSEVKIADQIIPVEGVVETHPDEIYVSIREIEKWFPIKLELNFNELRLYLETEENLPFEETALRRARWNRTKAQSENVMAREFEDAIVLPYRMYAAPAIQVQQNFNASQSKTTANQTYSTSVQTQGDLLGMASRINLGYLSGSDQQGEFNNSYFNLSRRDPHSKLAGPLKATSLEIGDVSGEAIPLVGSVQRGRGVKVGNTPYNFVRDPNSFYLEGFAPAGWDVEVYQDERLLSFQTVPVDGRYVFDDLQLREGFNLFRIVQYGPNGEKEVRYERYYLGRNIVDKGKFVYEATALQSSTPLFNVSNEEETDPTLALYGEYGLTENMSVNAGYYYMPLNGGVLNALGSGLRFGSNSAFYQFNTLFDASGGYSGSVDMTGNLTQDVILSASHTQHEGYADNIRPIVQDSYVNFTQRFSEGFLQFGSYGFGVRRRLTDKDVETYNLTNNISASLFDTNFSNVLEYELQSSLGNERMFGDLTARRRTSLGMFRGRLNYDLTDSFELSSMDILYQTFLNETTSLNLFATSVFGAEKLNTFSGGITKRFDKFQLSTNASINDDGDMLFGLALSMNFIPQSLTGDYRMTGSPSDLYLGSLEVQPFLDIDEDGVQDENEETVPGVLMRNMLRNTKSVSNENGSATLAGLTPDVVNRITVDAKTLPSIYMTPAKERINVLGRPGIAGPIGYPLILLGEISGMVYAPSKGGDDDALKPLADIEMILLNEENEVVAQTYSEYDGFFIFPSLRMGNYHLYLPPSEGLKAYHNGKGEGPTLTLTPSAPEVADMGVVLLPEQIVSEAEMDESMLDKALAFFGFGKEKSDEQQPEPQVAVETVVNENKPTVMPESITAAIQNTDLPKPQGAPIAKPIAKKRNGGTTVQAGFYCEEKNAARIYETLLIAGFDVAMTPRVNNGKACYSIEVTPRKEAGAAESLRGYLTDMGLEGVYITQ